MQDVSRRKATLALHRHLSRQSLSGLITRPQVTSLLTAAADGGSGQVAKEGKRSPIGHGVLRVTERVDVAGTRHQSSTLSYKEVICSVYKRHM